VKSGKSRVGFREFVERGGEKSEGLRERRDMRV